MSRLANVHLGCHKTVRPGYFGWTWPRVCLQESIEILDICLLEHSCAPGDIEKFLGLYFCRMYCSVLGFLQKALMSGWSFFKRYMLELNFRGVHLFVRELVRSFSELECSHCAYSAQVDYCK